MNLVQLSHEVNKTFKRYNIRAFIESRICIHDREEAIYIYFNILHWNVAFIFKEKNKKANDLNMNLKDGTHEVSKLFYVDNLSTIDYSKYLNKINKTIRTLAKSFKYNKEHINLHWKEKDLKIVSAIQTGINKVGIDFNNCLSSSTRPIAANEAAGINQASISNNNEYTVYAMYKGKKPLIVTDFQQWHGPNNRNLIVGDPNEELFDYLVIMRNVLKPLFYKEKVK